LLEVSEASASARSASLFHDLSDRCAVIDFDFCARPPRSRRNVMRLHVLASGIPAGKTAGSESPVEGNPRGVWQTQPSLWSATPMRRPFSGFLQRYVSKVVLGLPLHASIASRHGLAAWSRSEFGHRVEFWSASPATVAVAVDKPLNFATSQAYQRKLGASATVSKSFRNQQLMIPGREVPNFSRNRSRPEKRAIHHDSPASRSSKPQSVA